MTLPNSRILMAERYIAHVNGGKSIRALARENDVEPSTISRQVQKIEELVDDAFMARAVAYIASGKYKLEQDLAALSILTRTGFQVQATVDLDVALIRNGSLQVDSVRTDAVALWYFCGWLAQSVHGKFSIFHITEQGIKTIKAQLSDIPGITKTHPKNAPKGKRAPIDMLLGRKDRQGRYYISHVHAYAAKRLYTDFIKANHPDQKVTMNWDEVANKVDTCSEGYLIPGSWFGQDTPNEFEKALQYVGNHLSEVLVLAICYELGLEQIEARLAWPARSSKIVLMIALDRLLTYYQEAADNQVG